MAGNDFVAIFAIPDRPDGDVLVLDNGGRRMVMDPDVMEVRGGDGDFSVVLISANRDKPVEQGHRHMRSLMGKLVKVTVEVVEG